MKAIGETQRNVLECLLQHGSWHPACGWIWGTCSQTTSILLSLVTRGLVSTHEIGKSVHGPVIQYRITESGRQEVFTHSAYYKLKYESRK